MRIGEVLTMAEYIDREDAKRELLEWAVIIQRPRYLLSEDAMCVLDNIPAADVAPVRHGRWMKKHDAVMYWRQCSECGNIMQRNFYGNEWNSPYCPNCGAKMDGDNND